MKKFYIFLFLLIPIDTFSNENLISKLNDGNKIVFIRHALAPGNGDPENFDINNCLTQRNLNEKGRQQSKKIGKFFLDNYI